MATATLTTGLAEPVRFCPVDVVDPFDTVTWIKRNAFVKDSKTGRNLFEQNDVECPSTWSEDAVNMVASKYFYGLQGTPARETSIRQVIHRIARTIADWGREAGHFDTAADTEEYYRELVYLCLHQFAAFNSPVWFNLGLHHIYGVESGGGSTGYIYDPLLGRSVEVDPMKHPQCSACFILGLKDSVDSIWDASKDAAKLFKYGSGAGMDLSPLRSKHEPLSGGGKASGPISFGKLIDTTGGTIKSGGRTRRAAIMLTLKCLHPEAMDFTVLKSNEEKKAKALIAAGFPSDYNGEAYSTVGFQNANLSIRLTNHFMESALTGREWQTKWVTDPSRNGPKYPAKDLLYAISEGTHVCGDPGTQFEDTIQQWHTCPNTEPINSSNPCSEYKFLDDTACNLASFRLTKFLRENGTFDVDAFRAAIRIMFRAQEIIVGKASYPTAKIAERSYKFRPLGLGYADLGALLMVSGMAYDSDDGRALCGAVTAIMTGESYWESARMAQKLGAFEGFGENREPMLNVMRMHRAAVNTIHSSCPKYLVDAATEVWDEAVELGSEFGYRNAQATVLAPTGTISFAMDCDTTGIEPELGLVRYKLLAGGGNMKLVNRLVPQALRNLGYTPDAIEEVSKYVSDHGGTEGCSQIRSDHRAVFDTSFPMAGGKRSIAWKAHIDMMAAAQPFISGAISKTVNLPSDASIQDITDAIVDAWKKGLKAVAMYRDGSKWSQPLSTTEGGNNKTKDESVPVVAWGNRKKMPEERDAKIYPFTISGHDGYIKVGLFEDGTPGEVFLQMNKAGSTIDGLMAAIGMLISFNLQHGAPLAFLCRKLAYMDFEPRGFTGNAVVPVAKSVVDYLARFLEAKFVSKPVAPKDATLTEPDVKKSVSESAVATGPLCVRCGAMTSRIGPCFFCRSCGHSDGGCGG